MPNIKSLKCSSSRLAFETRREAVVEAKEIYLTNCTKSFVYKCENEDCKNVGMWHLSVMGEMENDLSLVAIQNASMFLFYEEMQVYADEAKKEKRARQTANRSPEYKNNQNRRRRRNKKKRIMLEYLAIESWENEGGALWPSA